MRPLKTPLHDRHVALKGRLVDFAGWSLPVQYESLTREHHAVRRHAGMFDVSHMGEILIHGADAASLLQKATCNDVSRLRSGECQYSALLYETGTFVDDIIINKLSPERFLVCVNASNTDKDFQWIKSFENPNARVENVSDQYFQIAVQGPEVAVLFPQIFPQKSFTFLETVFEGRPCLVARTGYTGEDGVEIYGRPDDAGFFWDFFLDKGVSPCGLGARDTLRLEAALPLYGHEIDDKTLPFEAGLGWIVKMDKGDFCGRSALARYRDTPPPETRTLVGLMMEEAGIARQGHVLFSDDTGETIGNVVSGTFSPTLEKAIATGFVLKSFSQIGAKIRIDIHSKKRQAVITSRPFYRRK